MSTESQKERVTSALSIASLETAAISAAILCIERIPPLMKALFPTDEAARSHMPQYVSEYGVYALIGLIAAHYYKRK